ncbi:MAG: toll/interleukin-1 receptor domain-containing protein [Chlorobium sp.]
MDKQVKKSWIRPLNETANYFLQVLVDSISLKRKRCENGASMTVTFDSDAQTIWNRRGKDEIRERVISDYSLQWPKIAENLEAFFFGNSGLANCDLPNKTFPFRFCSGGALPLITIGDKQYYRLHWRDIHPVGWNIVNGGSDNLLEMLDPQRIIYRELLEELLIFDINGSDWRRLTPQIEDGPAWLENPREGEVLRLWKIRFLQNGMKYNSIRQERLALGWTLGPDDLKVTFVDQKKNVVLHGEALNVFLNVNAEDFGIEVDCVVQLELPETAVICDGELLEGILLNSAIGLFEVQAMHRALREGKTEFKPDILFHGGRRYDDSDLLHVISLFLSEKSRNGLLRDPEKKQFEEAKRQKLEFNLCPVSRNILRRVAPLMKPVTPEDNPLDVFISFASEDEEHAQVVYDFLRNNLNINVFFSPEHRRSDFTNEIFKAITHARSMIVVCSRPEHLHKNWVNYEYTEFFRKKMNVPDKTMFTVLIDLPKDTPLPDPLGHFQAIACRKESLADDLYVLRQYLASDAR